MANCIYSQGDAKKPLSDAEKIVGLSQCWSEAKYNYVYFDKLTLDWDSLYKETIPVVLATKNDFDYFRELQRFIALLKDGHSGVSWPSELWSNWATIPVSTKLIDGKVIVNGVFNDTLKQAGIKKGIELIKIKGIDVHEYVSIYIKPYIHSSTEQWLNLKAYGRECTRGKKSESVNLTFKDNKGKIFEYTISYSMSEEENQKNNSLFDFKVIENNIGLLKVSAFWGDKYVQQFDSVYNLIKDIDGLIIDIRGNGGGNSNYSAYILSHLTNKSFTMSDWSSPMYIPAHASWNYPKEWYTQKSYRMNPVKNKTIFEKPVVLLINESTFSAAEDFCVGFRNMKRGLIVGSPTGGSTGNPIPIELPGDGWLQICTKKDTYPDGTEFVGIGILPDIEVKETVSSYLSIGPDSDRSLTKEKAIEILKQNIQKK
jgi:C-terminal processing protease CtpA/Prc